MTDLLTSRFACAWLLTMRYASDPLPPLAITDSQLLTLLNRARCLAGGPFPYVRLTDYSPSAARVTAYRLIVDLPADICRELAGRWFMGEATVDPLDAQQLAALAADLSERPEGFRTKGRKTWSTSRGFAQR